MHKIKLGYFAAGHAANRNATAADYIYTLCGAELPGHLTLRQGIEKKNISHHIIVDDSKLNNKKIPLEGIPNHLVPISKFAVIYFKQCGATIPVLYYGLSNNLSVLIKCMPHSLDSTDS